MRSLILIVVQRPIGEVLKCLWGREDFDSWCILAGLNPDAARERLRQRQAEAA
jgi:hypothetical protein